MNKIKEAFSEIKPENELMQKTLRTVTNKAPQKKPCSPNRALGLVAGAVCVVVRFIVGGMLFTTPTASVSMDVNPSIELSLNRFDRVLIATPKNKDAERVLSGLELKNRTYAEALQLIVVSQQELGYLQDGSDMVFAVQSDNTKQQEKLLQESGVYAGRIVGQQHTTCYAVNNQDWEEAHQHGVSPGKYKAIQELQQYDATVTLGEYAHHSLHDIRQEIRHHQNGEAVQDSNSTQGQCSENGHSGADHKNDSLSEQSQGQGYGHNGKHGNGSHKGNNSGGNGINRE